MTWRVLSPHNSLLVVPLSPAGVASRDYLVHVPRLNDTRHVELLAHHSSPSRGILRWGWNRARSLRRGLWRTARLPGSGANIRLRGVRDEFAVYATAVPL